MIYFDTDIIVNSYVRQDKIKNLESNRILEFYQQTNDFIISVLTIQEALFVFEKLRLGKEEIESAFIDLSSFLPVEYDIDILRRAVELAKQIGFRNINDCIHASIAERYDAEIITYNKKDFKKLQVLMKTPVRIL